MINIFIAEDDPLIKQVLESLLEGHQCYFFTTLIQLYENAPSEIKPDLLLLDLCHAADLEGFKSVEKIPDLKRKYPHTKIAMQSGLQDIAIMRRCIEYGAHKFILKESLSDEIPLLLQQVIEESLWRQSVEALILGQTTPVKELKQEILLLKTRGTSFDVLIEGETGVGKELCAKALHQPLQAPYIEVNAGAIPDELFEMSFFGAEKGAYTGATQARSGYFSDAQNGTLFIDEVQNLSWSNQAKLLRVLESRSYQRLGSSQNLSFKGRIIFATNIHLHQKVQEGHFREDLYYRISQVKLHVPPLRLRREDIPQLANSFLKSELKNPLRFTDKALLYLQDSYDWPGNVRELRGLIKDLAYKHPLPLIDALDIEQALNGKWASWTEEAKNKASPESFQINWQEDFDTNIKTLEKYLLKIGLDKWGSRETREKFKISRSRFYDKLKEYKLISD